MKVKYIAIMSVHRKILPQDKTQRRNREPVSRNFASPARSGATADVTCVFDLGSSGNSAIARDKDSLIGDSFASARAKARSD
jgi:hypothetical protein